jgi:transposase
MTTLFGIDVSKATLMVARLDGTPWALPNQPAAIQRWLATLPPDTIVAMEATGRFHRPLADLADARGFTVYVFNPRDVHRYAQSLSPRAATDPIAARLIAEFAAVTRKHPVYHTPPAYVDTLKTLLRTRASLVRHLLALRQQVHEAPGLTAVVQPLVLQFRETLQQLVQQLTTLAQQQPAYAWLRAIPGVGDLTAAYLVALLATHAFATADAFVAYLGLDVRIKESGQFRGKRKLTKRGDPEARRLLYLAALAAARSHPAFTAIRQRALDAGYSKTAAAIVVARKLARTAWSLYTHQQTFTADRVQHAG